MSRLRVYSVVALSLKYNSVACQSVHLGVTFSVDGLAPRPSCQPSAAGDASMLWGVPDMVSCQQQPGNADTRFDAERGVHERLAPEKVIAKVRVWWLLATRKCGAAVESHCGLRRCGSHVFDERDGAQTVWW